MNVGIIGSGTVGSATGIGLSKLGHNVIFSDVNKSILEKLSHQGYDVTPNYTQLMNQSQACMHEKFVESVMNNQPVPVTPEEGRETIRVMEMILDELNRKYYSSDA